MPIRPSMRPYYRKFWHALSRHLRHTRANNTCECAGLCGGHEGPCGAVQGAPHPRTGGKVYLTVAHLDQDPRVHDPARLGVFCPSCHVRYDRRPEQIARREHVFREIMGQTTLFPDARDRAWRQSNRAAISWVRAVRLCTVHAAPPHRTARTPFYDIATRRPMTITQFSRITAGLPGWSRTTVRMCVNTSKASSTRGPRGHALYDPRDIVAAVAGDDGARFVFGEADALEVLS